MKIALDSNEYINFLNRKSLLLDKLFANENVNIYINGDIVKEVLRNVKETLKGEFYKILFKYKIEVNNEKLPFYLFNKYKKLSLKKGDFIIAAFCEFVEADYLITENRHFLMKIKFDKFDVITIKEFSNKLTEQGKNSGKK